MVCAHSGSCEEQYGQYEARHRQSVHRQIYASSAGNAGEKSGRCIIRIAMNKRTQRVLAGALIAVGSTVVTLLLSDIRLFKILNAKAFDSHFLVRGQQPTHDIVLVTADQKALDTFKDVQLFWHPHYADAIRAVGKGGAKVLGLDLAFGVPVSKWEPEHDRILAEAVTSAPMPVVVGYVAALNTNQSTDRRAREHAGVGARGLTGFSNLTTDAEDDFIRRQELRLEAGGRNLLGDARHREVPGPHPADGPVDCQSVRSSSTIAAVRDVSTPFDGGRRGEHSDERLRKWFQDKIVLLGTDFPGDSDRRNTPFFTLSQRRSMADGWGRDPCQHDPHTARPELPVAGSAVGPRGALLFATSGGGGRCGGSVR